MNTVLLILHPSVPISCPAVNMVCSILAPRLIKTMHQPLTEEERGTLWSHFLLFAPPNAGDSVFAWLSQYPSLLSECSQKVGFIEFGEDLAEDTWLLDQRFWELSISTVPLADRFGSEDVIQAQDFALALLGEQ